MSRQKLAVLNQRLSAMSALDLKRISRMFGFASMSDFPAFRAWRLTWQTLPFRATPAMPEHQSPMHVDFSTPTPGATKRQQRQ